MLGDALELGETLDVLELPDQVAHSQHQVAETGQGAWFECAEPDLGRGDELGRVVLYWRPDWWPAVGHRVVLGQQRRGVALGQVHAQAKVVRLGGDAFSVADLPGGQGGLVLQQHDVLEHADRAWCAGS